MKKLFLYSLLAVMTMGLATSCSDDKNDNPGPDKTDYAAAVAGIYKGDMTVTVAGAPSPSTTEKIYLTRTADNKATLEIKNFSYQGLSLGSIKVENVDVTAATKATTTAAAVSGEGTVTITLEGTPISAAVTVSGTIVGDKADLTIDVAAGALAVKVGFKGDKIEKDTPDYAQAVAGVYKGDLTVTFGEPGQPEKQKVYVVRTNENEAELSIKNFAYMGIPLGDIVLHGVTVGKKSDDYTVTGEDNVKVNLGQGQLDAKAALEGTIAADGAANLTITVTVDGLGPIGVTFAGSKDAGANTEAKILSVQLNSSLVSVQPALTGENEWVFYMKPGSTTDDLKDIVTNVTVSDYAAVAPASGSAVDYSDGPVEFTVTAEDGTTTQTYTVEFGGIQSVKYSFEDWELYSGNEGAWVPVESSGWSTSIAASLFLPLYGVTVESQAVAKVDKGYQGNAVAINSIDSRAAYDYTKGMVPALTSGSLFLGKFKLNITNTLASTRFGNIYSGKPVEVTGYYKYKSGDSKMIDNKGEETTGTDEGSITAVLYEVADENETLDGTNVNTSKKIVGYGQLITKDQADFAPFSIKLDYKQEYNPDKMYKFAIVCSSSKNGNLYNEENAVALGANASQLIVDEISVIDGM